jgi:hypothetical protein
LCVVESNILVGLELFKETLFATPCVELEEGFRSLCCGFLDLDGTRDAFFVGQLVGGHVVDFFFRIAVRAQHPFGEFLGSQLVFSSLTGVERF